MSENIIKEGDFVRVRGRETSCEVLIAKKGINAIAVEETRKYATTYNREEVERIDPKTAFLHDLSELLRKYNAVINASWDEYFDNGYPKIDLDINFNGHVEGICFENVLDNSLTADNVLNYDK